MFFAVPEFILKDWTPVNAVFWVARMILQLHNNERPDEIYFVSDAPWKTFRHDILEEYKWTRDRMPDNLKLQDKLIFEVVEKMWIPILKKDWFEADDIIWTLAVELWADKNNEVYILSSDKDLHQFVTDNVYVYDAMKKKVFAYEDTLNKFWVEPKYIVDYLAIVWDTSDNIPWVAGFWPKKAEALINEYWNLENIYKNADKIKWKLWEKFRDSKEVAFLSKKLATIDINVDLWEFKYPDNIDLLNNNVINLFLRLEFKSLLPKHLHKEYNFEEFWNEIIDIKNNKELEELLDEILKSKKIILSTIWETFNLGELSINIIYKNNKELNSKNISNNNKIYKISLDINKEDLNKFLKEILSLDILLYWFDIKSDIKRIRWFIKYDERVNTEVMSLF